MPNSSDVIVSMENKSGANLQKEFLELIPALNYSQSHMRVIQELADVQESNEFTW